MINKKLTGCLVALILGSGTGLANSRYIFYAVNDSTNEQSTTAKTNDKENQKATKDKEKPSSYEQLIKKGGSVNDGLFTIRHIEDKWYYELPDSILGRYLLAVTRFTAVPQNFGKFSSNATTIRLTFVRTFFRKKQTLRVASPVRLKPPLLTLSLHRSKYLVAIRKTMHNSLR